MAASVIFEKQVEVPLGIRSLDGFRRWAHSGTFPERGRIDYISGNIEVDLSPDAEGFQCSSVLGCAYRLERRRGPQGDWEFDLHETEM